MDISNLPEDILPIILSFLPPSDYLALCRTCKSIYTNFRQDSIYWRTLTSDTFRLPISPLLAADGPRWYWLYKRLKTQTQLYTWGQGVSGNLGPGRALPIQNRGRLVLPDVVPRGFRLPNRPPPPQVFQRTSSNWPTEVHLPDDVGVIVDLQCGGWSTTILTSEGKLFTVGAIDSLHGTIPSSHSNDFVRLEYVTQSTSAIRQFSSGRRHILALTDDGEILSWDRSRSNGLKVFSRTGRDFGAKPTRVAAGWAESSAYVPTVGIIYWAPLQNHETTAELDGVHVQEKIIPGTARTKTETGTIEVVKHIVLEDFIVYITSDSKIFACNLSNQNPDQSEPTHPPFPVPGYAAEGRQLKDIHGQYKSFGVFTAAGEVLAGDADYLRRCQAAVRNDPEILTSNDWSTLTSILPTRPPDVPALQHSNVIGLAYGDYHYHALHADGRITSYGRESQSCGQLGLGSMEAGGRFRGLTKERAGPRGDGDLLPIANIRGRQIWFEPERKDWLAWLEEQVTSPGLATNNHAALNSWLNPNRQAAFSEWIEQEGRHWDEGPLTGPTGSTTDTDMNTTSAPSSSAVATTTTTTITTGDYVLGAYFPIAIAAAGWHSGALVLKDQEKADEIRSKWVVSQERSIPGSFEKLEQGETYAWKLHGFPKVTLPNGIEMPGVGEPRPWRDGVPTMADLGLPS